MSAAFPLPFDAAEARPSEDANGHETAGVEIGLFCQGEWADSVVLTYPEALALRDQITNVLADAGVIRRPA